MILPAFPILVEPQEVPQLFSQPLMIVVMLLPLLPHLILSIPLYHPLLQLPALLKNAMVQPIRLRSMHGWLTMVEPPLRIYAQGSPGAITIQDFQTCVVLPDQLL